MPLEQGKEHFHHLEQQAKSLPAEEQKSFWKQQIHRENVNRTDAVRALMYYRLAGTYYNSGELDSLKFYMQKAWDKLQLTSEKGEAEVLLNYGEGNIATIEGNIHQENYYFNLAAQQIVSDPLLDLTAIQKASIFMATA